MSQDRKQKMLALLASSTNEGEALTAWRMLRKAQPEGRLFGDEKFSPHDTSAYAAGHRAGYMQGVEVMKRNIDKQIKANIQAYAERRYEQMLKERSPAKKFFDGVFEKIGTPGQWMFVYAGLFIFSKIVFGV